MVCGEHVACLLREEHDFRNLIDSRLKVGLDEAKVPSLIRLCRDHGLGDFEKHILLLGMVACLGTTAAEKHLFGLESVYASSQLYPEIVFEFLELSYEERIHALPKLLAEGVLRREGMIQMCYDPATPAAVVGAGIELTGKAVALMTGIPSFEGFSESKL